MATSALPESETKFDMSFLKSLVKDINDKNTYVGDEGLNSAEFTGTIDTGSYLFNAQLSGDLFGGAPNNKVMGLAGEEATGKTFFALAMIKQFLIDNPTGICVYYDTEAAVTKGMLEASGIDPRRVIIVETTTIQEFRTHGMKMLDAYLTKKESERPPIIMVLDSLGQLSTLKEVTDIGAGADTKDMTRSGLIRAAFRVLNLRLAKAKIPFICTNHTYAAIGAMGPSRPTIAGGGGLKYAASQIVQFSKKLDRDGKEVVGGIIHCFLYKSRFTKEKTVVDVRLSYSKGLDRYYGLFDWAYQNGAILRPKGKYHWADQPIEGNPKLFNKSECDNDPATFWTRERLEYLNGFCAQKFKYGQGDEPNVTRDEDELDSEVRGDEEA